MQRARSAFAIVAVYALAGCGGGGSGSAYQAPTAPPPGGGGGSGVAATVVVANNHFEPPSVSVRVGNTVDWRWDSCTGDGYGGQICTSHSVTFDAGGPGASEQSTGTFARTFTAAGTYAYYCTVHGRAAMAGTVVVQP